MKIISVIALGFVLFSGNVIAAEKAVKTDKKKAEEKIFQEQRGKMLKKTTTTADVWNKYKYCLEKAENLTNLLDCKRQKNRKLMDMKARN